MSELHMYYQQLHLTVMYEKNFLDNLKSLKNLYLYRDDILDNINLKRRILKYI